MAVDEELKRTVALKEIQPRLVEHPGCRQQFLREAKITGCLEHPGIVPVYDLDLQIIIDALATCLRLRTPTGFRPALVAVDHFPQPNNDRD